MSSSKPTAAAAAAASSSTTTSNHTDVYDESVLGRSCLILFDTDAGDRTPYQGVVLAYEATLQLKEDLEAKVKQEATTSTTTTARATRAAAPKKTKKKDKPRAPRTMKYRTPHPAAYKPVVQRLHHVTFSEDRDERWLDLAELQADGRLWWQDVVPEDVAAAVQKGTKQPNAATLPATTTPATNTTAMPPMQQQQQLMAQQQLLAQQQLMRTTQNNMNLLQNPQYQAALQAHYRGTAQLVNPNTGIPRTAPPQTAAAGMTRNDLRGVVVGTVPPAGTATTIVPNRPVGRPKKGTEPTTSPPKTPKSPKADIPWLKDMRHFLEHVPHGKTKKVCSLQNARAVVRQIEKLATGQGVTHRAWAPDIFYHDHKVDVKTADVAKLWADAVAFEKIHPDTSGGWNLRHPLRQFECYVTFLKDHPEGAMAAIQSGKVTTAEYTATPKKVKAEIAANQKTPAGKEVTISFSKSDLAGDTPLGLELVDIHKHLKHGVSVLKVKPGSLAKRVGVKVGWVGLSINGKSAEHTDSKDFVVMVKTAKEGLKDDEKLTIVFRVPTRKATPAKKAAKATTATPAGTTDKDKPASVSGTPAKATAGATKLSTTAADQAPKLSTTVADQAPKSPVSPPKASTTESPGPSAAQAMASSPQRQAQGNTSNQPQDPLNRSQTPPLDNWWKGDDM